MLIVFACGVTIIIIGLMRIFHNININIDMRNGIMNEMLIGSIAGVPEDLMKDYIIRLRKYGLDSPQVNTLKNANKDNEYFIYFTNNIDKIGKQLW